MHTQQFILMLCTKAVEKASNASAYLGYLWHFMGSLALLARDLGHKVTGSDLNVYPPMSTQLENAGITLMQMTVVIYSLIQI